MSRAGREGASSGRASMAPSGEPQARARSTSRASLTSKNPQESTRRPRDDKLVASSAHISAARGYASRPGLRALEASSAVGSREGGSARGAGDRTGHNTQDEEESGSDDDLPDLVELGDSPYNEARARAIGTVVHTRTPPVAYRTVSDLLGAMGLGRLAVAVAQAPRCGNTTAQAAQIRPSPSHAVVPSNPLADPPVDRRNKPGENRNRDKEPNPGGETKARQSERRQDRNRNRGQRDKPRLSLGEELEEHTLIKDVPGPDPQEYPLRLRGGNGSEGNDSETRGETHPRDTNERIERARQDYLVLSKIKKDTDRRSALNEYEAALTANGGREPTEWAALDNQSTLKRKEKVPTTPKNRARGRTSLGVRTNQLEGERKSAHTPAPTPVNAKNRGLPTGGYLHNRLTNPANLKATTAAGGDPSDSNDSSSSSGSDIDDYRNMNPRELDRYIKKLKKRRKEKKEKEKLRKLQLSGYKTKLPTAYDGSSDFDTFEQFVYEVETWQEDTGFEDYEAVRHVKSFLEHKAANYYMLHVAPEATQFTLTSVFQGLFDYCFPPDIQARIRRKFNTMTQGDEDFRDFYRELCKIQRRLVDINKRSLAVSMWEGARTYIRVEWARNGYSAEHNTPEELEESALRFENAEKIRLAECERSDEWHQSEDKESDKCTSDEEESIEYIPRTNRLADGRDIYPRKEKVPRLSPEKFAEYRAAGKCVFCHTIGHIARDCPKRIIPEESPRTSSAVSFARIQELESDEEEAEEYSEHVYSVAFELGPVKGPQKVPIYCTNKCNMYSERPERERTAGEHEQDSAAGLQAVSAEISEHVPGPITRPILVTDEAAGVQIATGSAETVETRPTADKAGNTNRGNSPMNETNDRLPRHNRTRQLVNKLTSPYARKNIHTRSAYSANKEESAAHIREITPGHSSSADREARGRFVEANGTTISTSTTSHSDRSAFNAYTPDFNHTPTRPKSLRTRLVKQKYIHTHNRNRTHAKREKEGRRHNRTHTNERNREKRADWGKGPRRKSRMNQRRDEGDEQKARRTKKALEALEKRRINIEGGGNANSPTLKPIEPPIGEGECKDRVTSGHGSEVAEP